MVQIRAATTDDTEVLMGLIRDLARYERLEDHVTGDAALLHQHLFGRTPAAEAAIAENDGSPIGFALWFTTFSTFLCRPGLWLEDLFVLPEHRRGGVGRMLLEHVASVAVARDYGRVEWAVLDWNQPALDFYRSLGARPLDDWITHRVDGESLAQLAAAARPPHPP